MVPDYSAVFLPGTAFTLLLQDTDVLAGEPLEVAESGTCRRAAAGTETYVGIAGHDCYAGYLITVIAGKTVHEGPAEGPIQAGDHVAPSGQAPAPGVDGRQVVASTDPAEVIGLALTDADADGDMCRWLQR
jgi:hypothetical protein